MEGMKFDSGKARWDLVPTEYYVKLSQAIKPFIEMYLLKDEKIVFDRAYIYNVIRANIMHWRLRGAEGLLGRSHPLMNAMIGILMMAKYREYSYEEVFTEHELAQRWDLLCAEWTTKLAEVYAHGAIKYEDNNWQKVASGKERYYAALNRHLDDGVVGNHYDTDSGFLHWYHAAWNCIALMWIEHHIEANEIISTIPEPIKRAARKLSRVMDTEMTIVARPTKKKKKKRKS